MKKNKDLYDYSWVISGSQRRKIIKVMDKNKAKIPTKIKESTKLSLNNVSDVLRAFEKKKIAKCITPKAKTGRLYELTPKGMRIKEMIEQ